jgi:hypothetical protein
VTREERKAIRQAVADYMQAEGCSCCRNEDAHAKAKAVLAKLLRVQPYSDGDGFDFNRHATNPIK